MSAPAPRAIHAGPLLGGVALLVVYIRIGALLGFQASYGPPLPPLRANVSPFVWVSESEYRLWLAHLVLALPGALLVGWGLAPRVEPALRRLVARVDAAAPRTWGRAAIAFFLVLVAWSVIGRHLVLLDRPLTDDENAVTFGARVLAGGRLHVPLLQPLHAYTELFLFEHDGTVCAMDFPGVLLFAAASVATGLGGLLFALACGTTGVAVAYAAGRWFGARARALAALLWLASPMVGALSITTHGHIWSRMCVALALAFASRLDTAAGTPRRDAALVGLWAGVGFLCRPFEVTALLVPLGAYLTWRALRARTLPRATPAWLAAGLVPALLGFAAYNQATTGVWYLQARFSPGLYGASPSDQGTPWDRLGFNVGWNVLVLAVFFLGVPAIAALVGGLERRRPITLVLFGGFAIAALVGLAHDNTGIHSVGPIHLSECVVPLTLLVAAGVVRGAAAWTARGLSGATFGVVLAAYLILGLGAFALPNLASLRMQASTQAVPEDTLAALDIHHAVVIAPPYILLLQADKTFAPWGSWVLEYPHPSPDLDDDIIFARTTASRADLHARFPDRAIYEMSYSREPPAIRLAPVP